MDVSQAEQSYKKAPDQYSLSATLIWTFVLIFGVPILVNLVIVFLMAIIGYNNSDAWSFINKLDVGFILNIVVAMISYPLLKTACYHSDYRGLPLNFLAIEPIKLVTLMAVLSSLGGLLAGQHLIINWLEIAPPEFMLELKNNIFNTKDLVFVTLHTCILMPVIEEIVFRGMAYRRIELSRFGRRGAVIITTLLFTIFHLQYSWQILLFLLPSALLLGLIRYKTDNLLYCIATHMLMNAVAMVTLLMLPQA